MKEGKMNSKGNYYGGKWNESQGDYFCSVSPNDESVLWEGKNSTQDDVDACVYSAKKVSYEWGNLTYSERAEYIRRYVEIVKQKKEELTFMISREIGKPLWESDAEVNSVIGKFDASLSAYYLRAKELINPMSNGISRTHFKPLGVVAVLGPYNFPAHMSNGHIMPALLAGNTVIFKPSEKGSYVAERIMEYWSQAGLPAGVMNCLFGDGRVGEALCKHEEINGVFFTGSYKVGSGIAELCGTRKMCALEMGGNSPLVIWDASDIDAAAITTIQSAFITSGQRCSSARRLIIPDNKFGIDFVAKLLEYTKRIVVAPYDNETTPYAGPLRTREAVTIVLCEQSRLEAAGGHAIIKSEKLNCGEYFVSPGIIDVTEVSDRGDVEIIGPLLKLVRVKSFEDAITEANNTGYGLAAGIITEDREKYEEFSKKVDAGLINWNQQLTGASSKAPFGGIKNSGNYRPSGFLAVDYCVYAVASIEIEKLDPVEKLPVGFLN
jgi:NAD-dependent aldehyde dehydrogenases